MKSDKSSVCVCACLLTTVPQILVTPRLFPHITKTQECIQLTYLCHEYTSITGGGGGIKGETGIKTLSPFPLQVYSNHPQLKREAVL